MSRCWFWDEHEPTNTRHTLADDPKEEQPEDADRDLVTTS